MQSAILETEKTGRSAGKNPPVRRFAQAEKGDVRQMKRLVDPLEPFAMAPEESAVGAGPQIAMSIGKHYAHEFVGEAILGAEGPELPVSLLQQSAAIRCYLQKSIARPG